MMDWHNSVDPFSCPTVRDQKAKDLFNYMKHCKRIRNKIKFTK